ncbi:MAG: NADH-quinone oxidoreductase subunit M [Acidobacteria bacterium]|nr:NADH-quinone oxidoreductase subunit M [Acidobacteriota bacterium]
MGWFDNGWGLSLIVFLPLVGAVAVLLVPKAQEQLLKVTALAFAFVTFGLSVVLAIRFDYGASETIQFGTNQEWISAIGSNYHVGVDGISLPMILLSTFITVLALLYSWNHWPEPRNPKIFSMLILLLATGMTGTFAAFDLILFFVFFEIVLLPMYFMIGIWGDRNEVRIPVIGKVTEMRLYASIKFFLFTLFGSAFMLLGFIALYFRSGSGGEERTFDMIELASRGDLFTGSFGFWVFAALALGFAVKVPMFPFHTWLPDAHTAAPTVGSVLLAAVMLKLGTYAFIRISIPILPREALNWAPAIGILAVIGIIYASLACLAQTDMKRLIAFSSVGHMGFVMLGIATMTSIGINAAIIGMVAHGVITGLMFFVAGSMSHRYHTREMSRLGGNQTLMPIMGAILALSAMASLGLPGLAGFWGEFMALLSAFNPNAALDAGLFRTLMVIGAVGTVLTAGYLLWMLQKVNFGEPRESWDDVDLHDVDKWELLAWVPLVVSIIVIGVYPRIVTGATNDAVVELVKNAFGG